MSMRILFLGLLGGLFFLAPPADQRLPIGTGKVAAQHRLICTWVGFTRVCRPYQVRRHHYRRDSNYRRNKRRAAIPRGDSRVQTALNQLGFNAGPADGKFGPQTRAAIRRYQRSVGDRPTGRLNARQRRTLLAGLATPPPDEPFAPAAVAPPKPRNPEELAEKPQEEEQKSAALPEQPEMVPEPAEPTVEPQEGPQITAPAERPNPFAQASREADAFVTSIRARGKGIGGASAIAEMLGHTDTDSGSAYPEKLRRLCAATLEKPPVAAPAPANGDYDAQIVPFEVCVARAHILKSTAAHYRALGRPDLADFLGQCALTANRLKPAVGDLQKAKPEDMAKRITQDVAKAGTKSYQDINRAKACLGYGLGYEAFDISLAHALFLTGLGQDGYGEAVAAHLALGLGVRQNVKLSADWYRRTADKVDTGAEAVVDIKIVNRAQVLDVLADVLGDMPAGALPPLGEDRMVATATPEAPGKPKSQDAEASPGKSSIVVEATPRQVEAKSADEPVSAPEFFAAERERARKALAGLAATEQYDPAEFNRLCGKVANAIGQARVNSRDTVAAQLCRLVSYASGNKRHMAIFDTYLAKAGNSAARQAVDRHQEAGNITADGRVKAVAN